MIELEAKLPAHHQRSDADIAASAAEELKWNTLVRAAGGGPANGRAGQVTLLGKVEWHYQRRGIEKALRPLMGVVEIHNKITLRARTKAAELSHKIEKALTRQALLEARKIHVDVDGQA